MNREQAKVYAKLSREDIEKIDKELIDKGYSKHYDVLCAYSNGAEIEVARRTNHWESEKYPAFLEDFEYRVKPENAEQSSTLWKPKQDEEFFFLDSDMSVISTIFYGVPSYENLFSFGNCFRTREEAEAARERVRAALKGETVSKTENVENKSHVAELYEKLGEPSIAVFHCDGTDRERGAAVELDGDKMRVLEGLSFLFISLCLRGFKPDDLEKVLGIAIKHFYEHGKKIKVEKIEV